MKIIASPTSKSITQRAIAASMLAYGESTILNPALCDDTDAALSLAQILGATVCKKNDRFIIQGGMNPKATKLNAGESGLSLRMFTPIAALSGEKITITGKGSLLQRPVNMIVDSLKQGKVDCYTKNGMLPLSFAKKLQSGVFHINANITSQLLTGLLMALPTVEGDSIIFVDNLKSKPYIDVTIDVLEQFGIKIHNIDYKTFKIKGNQTYNPCTIVVEGDWSSAAFWFIVGAIFEDICITGLNDNTKQADKMILEACRCAHCNIAYENGVFFSRKSSISAFDFDASDCPDLIPVLTLLAACAKGISHISGALRLKHKESDRALVLIQEFEKMGILIKQQEDVLTIIGGSLKGGNINSHHDHRIAMTFAIASLIAESPVIIDNPECVSKSYPDFFKHLSLLKGGVVL